MALKTRTPSGIVPWPMVLVEGPEKSGKTWMALLLSTSKRVGRTVLVELGPEGIADQYGTIPGANYEIAEHNGTFEGLAKVIQDATEDAKAAIDAGELPMVLVIDTATEEWDLLKAIAEQRAKRSNFNLKRLRDDPNAEVVIDMTQWNHVTELHYEHVIEPLKAFPGIVVITARGKEVASMDANGRPIANTKTYKVEGQKNLAYDVSAWVQLSRTQAPTVVGMRSVVHGIRPGKDEPVRDADLSLEKLIFDLMGCDPKTAAPANVPTKSALQVAKGELWTAAQEMKYDMPKLAQVFAEENEGATLETATVEQLNACRDFLRLCLQQAAEKPVRAAA